MERNHWYRLSSLRDTHDGEWFTASFSKSAGETQWHLLIITTHILVAEQESVKTEPADSAGGSIRG